MQRTFVVQVTRGPHVKGTQTVTATAFGLEEPGPTLTDLLRQGWHVAGIVQIGEGVATVVVQELPLAPASPKNLFPAPPARPVPPPPPPPPVNLIREGTDKVTHPAPTILSRTAGADPAGEPGQETEQ